MRARLTHETETFTRGGDPYRKLGVGYGKHVEDAYAYWLYDRYDGVREYYMHFPAVGLLPKILFGFVNALGRTELTDDPDKATATELSWSDSAVDDGLKKILVAYFHDNKDELISSAIHGVKLLNKYN